MAKWLRANSNLIKPKQFEHLYAQCMERFKKYAALGALSDILIACDINPLQHVDKVVPGMFCGSDIQEITIPNNIKSIGINAFASCNKLEDVTIHDGISHIDNSAFMMCPRLKYVTLPDNLVTISKMLFQSCESLETISIPNSVQFIGQQAFYNCRHLHDIIYNGTSAEWESIPKGVSWNTAAGKDRNSVIQIQCDDTNLYMRCN